MLRNTRCLSWHSSMSSRRQKRRSTGSTILFAVYGSHVSALLHSDGVADLLSLTDIIDEPGAVMPQDLAQSHGDILSTSMVPLEENSSSLVATDGEQLPDYCERTSLVFYDAGGVFPPSSALASFPLTTVPASRGPSEPQRSSSYRKRGLGSSPFLLAASADHGADVPVSSQHKKVGSDPTCKLLCSPRQTPE